MSVVEAVEADLGRIRKADRALADSGLAASALVLARQLDDPATSATSKSMCARALKETLDRLRELTPAQAHNDRLDDLAKRREKRIRRRAAS